MSSNPVIKKSTYQVNVRSIGRAVQLVGRANRSITAMYTPQATLYVSKLSNYHFTTRNGCWKKTCGSPATLYKSYICTANKPIRMYSNKFSSSCHGNTILHSCKNQGHTHSSNCCHRFSRSRLWINWSLSNWLASLFLDLALNCRASWRFRWSPTSADCSFTWSCNLVGSTLLSCYTACCSAGSSSLWLGLLKGFI